MRKNFNKAFRTRNLGSFEWVPRFQKVTMERFYPSLAMGLSLLLPTPKKLNSKAEEEMKH